MNILLNDTKPDEFIYAFGITKHEAIKIANSVSNNPDFTVGNLVLPSNSVLSLTNNMPTQLEKVIMPKKDKRRFYYTRDIHPTNHIKATKGLVKDKDIGERLVFSKVLGHYGNIYSPHSPVSTVYEQWAQIKNLLKQPAYVLIIRLNTEIQ